MDNEKLLKHNSECLRSAHDGERCLLCGVDIRDAALLIKKTNMFNTFSHIPLGKGRATLAIQVEGDNLEIGVAFCSPKDQFSKAKGRMIAEGRLKAKHGFYMKIGRNPDEKLKDQARRVVVTLVKNVKTHMIPRWAKKVTHA